MTAAAVAHVVVSGLATGSIYALVALSLVIIYNATRTVNFAQGEMFMVSTFVAWSVVRAGAPLGVAVVAAGVGAVAGVLYAAVGFLSAKMGLIVINGFIAAVLGGFGSMPGAILGGMLLGVLENLAPLYLPTGIRYSVPFLVLIAILLM